MITTSTGAKLPAHIVPLAPRGNQAHLQGLDSGSCLDAMNNLVLRLRKIRPARRSGGSKREPGTFDLSSSA